MDNNAGEDARASDDEISRILAAMKAGPLCAECIAATIRMPARRLEAVWPETLRHTFMLTTRCNSCRQIKVTYQRIKSGRTREP